MVTATPLAMFIDAHVHLYPDGINGDPSGWAERAGERHWATLCTRRRKGGQAVQGFPSVDELLRTMDEAGVERAILLSWYWEHLESCRLQNRFYASCIHAYPDRFYAFASVHPGPGGAGESAALAELDWAREHGLCGVGELSPHSVGWAVDDPLLAAVFERAGDWGWPVNLHVTEADSRPYPGKVETPLSDFLTLAERHPRTRFILAHWGANLPLVVTGKLPSNLYFDTAASPLIYGRGKASGAAGRGDPVSSPNESLEGPWRKFVDTVGADRVLFGSDYPLNLYPALNARPEMRRFADEFREQWGLTPDEIRVIGGDNARKLLGLR
ncbi:hypothetical protein AXK12_01855 [Cephaloticoccus capnophilus]|uniref:Amidohydrolase-related domain-containing protein n=1 Tax=Cephaloticoccus capnophilus TaxID=1548208 RepID=A0A139SSD7_9BACT|nr:hypothetical protein AXK12_01855 [Cephaloticoccus capnophilus]